MSAVIEEQAGVPLPDLCIVTAVNDDQVLAANLLRSPILAGARAPIVTYRDQPSASIAYNRGIAETESEYVAFVHQDVYLPLSFEENLLRSIRQIEKTDPDWAVLGSIGATASGATVGHVWSSGSGREFGYRLETPVEVVTLDEVVVVVRRASQCLFDECLPSFHLYATDIVRAALAAGKRSYVGELPVVHNSRTLTSLGGGFTAAYRYMRRKWRHVLPLQTLVVPVTTSPLPLARARMRIRVSRQRRLARAWPNTTDPRDIAQRLNYE